MGVLLSEGFSDWGLGSAGRSGSGVSAGGVGVLLFGSGSAGGDVGCVGACSGTVPLVDGRGSGTDSLGMVAGTCSSSVGCCSRKWARGTHPSLSGTLGLSTGTFFLAALLPARI